jgi:hypothetical protein
MPSAQDKVEVLPTPTLGLLLCHTKSTFPLRWSSFFDQFAALLRWIRVSCQAANLIGSVLFA